MGRPGEGGSADDRGGGPVPWRRVEDLVVALGVDFQGGGEPVHGQRGAVLRGRPSRRKRTALSVTAGSMSRVVTWPVGPTSPVVRAALQPPEPISRTRRPGWTRAASSMSARSQGAETELVVVPSGLWRVATTSSA
ncbi:hypothetical protein GCM10023329_42010 [Streptomyces sanyensis]|uniref:Uncharacterized protein n=1 Tax=Streptomyces sanyensis TaxID=568869 RepID=A0ABP9AXC7_9ACTN